MPLGVLVHNEHGVIVFANAQVGKLVGVSERRELLGKLIGELFAPPFLKGLRDGLVAGTPDVGELTPRVREQLIRADGTWLEVELAAVPFVVGGEGQVQLMFHGITPPEAKPGSAWPARSAKVGMGRVLVVDDDELLRRVARRVLTRAGYEVIEASDGPTALTTFEVETGLAGVLLDLGLPGLSGELVLLRMLAARPETPIVLCSGHLLDDRYIADLTGLGRIGFLRKPFGADDLVSELQRVLGQR